MFTVGGLGKEEVDILRVGVFRLVIDEGSSFFRSGRQTGEINGGPACEIPAVGPGGGFQSVALQSGQDEFIGMCLRPGRMVDLGPFRAFRNLIGPVPVVLGSLCDPALEEIDLLLPETFALVRGRHALLLILVNNTCDQLALVDVTGNDCGVAPEVLGGTCQGIE